MSLSRLLWRSIVACLGWLVAVIASLAVVITATLVVPVLHAGVTDAPPISPSILLGIWRGIELAPTLVEAIWPGWLLLAVVVEVIGLRSLIVHFAAFAGLAVVAVLGLLPEAGPTTMRLAVAAAFVAGFLHWLVAGRTAGLSDPTAALAARKGGPQEPHA